MAKKPQRHVHAWQKLDVGEVAMMHCRPCGKLLTVEAFDQSVMRQAKHHAWRRHYLR